jgi:predicted ATP-dependent serine protease
MKTITSARLEAKSFKTLALSEKWERIMGKVTGDFKLFIYGFPASGKSTFCTDLALELSKHGKCLYVSGEENADYTVALRIKALGGGNSKLEFTTEKPTLEELLEPNKYDFLIVDSLQSLKLTVPQIHEFLKTHAAKGIVVVSQVTNEGKNPLVKIEHLCGIKVELKKTGEGISKSRYLPQPVHLKLFNPKGYSLTLF